MNSRHRSPLSAFILLLALACVAFLAGCGDDDSPSGGGGSVGSDTDPQEVLDAALGSDQQIDSGVLDLAFDLTATGSDAGTVTASLTGPFQSAEEEGGLPEIDFDAVANVDAADTTFDFEGGLTLTGDGAFVSYNGEDYALDEATFGLLQQGYEQSSQLQEEGAESGSLQQFGVDPATWITDLTNEGTEDIDGTEVVHISGTGDVGAIVEDLTSIAEQTGQAAQIDPAQLGQLEELVQSATIDVFASTEDDTLRQLDLNMEIADPTTDGNATILFSVGIAEPNEEQEITGPSDARPIVELLDQIPGGAEALGGLGAVAGGSGAASPVAPPAGVSDEYYDCVAGAQSAADLEACGTP